MVEQLFTPALRIMKNGKLHQIQSRRWIVSEESSDYTVQFAQPVSENMGVLGVQQIEEIWKFYAAINGTDSGIYISNLGYVMEVNDKEVQELFGDAFVKSPESGVIFRTLNDKQKQCIRECNFIPENNRTSGYQIDLYVKQLGVSYKIYRMVAEKFLDKPKGKNIVHHIDNNSYNNSVTNLIWLNEEEHRQRIHPMSYWR